MRGQLGRAWELASSIGSDGIAEPLLRPLDRLRQPAPGAERASRNQPCPCGSGRKYKACCRVRDLDGGVHPLPHRAPALYAMLATYARRGPNRNVADRMAACAIGAPHAAMLALDLAIFDGGTARRFLAARGHLLRDDERDLLRRVAGRADGHVRGELGQARVGTVPAQPGRRAAAGRPARPAVLAFGPATRHRDRPAAAGRRPARRRQQAPAGARRDGYPAPRPPRARRGAVPGRPGRAGKRAAVRRTAAVAVRRAVIAGLPDGRRRRVPVVRNDDRGRLRREGLAAADPALPGSAAAAGQGRRRLLRLSQVAARALLDTQYGRTRSSTPARSSRAGSPTSGPSAAARRVSR